MGYNMADVRTHVKTHALDLVQMLVQGDVQAIATTPVAVDAGHLIVKTHIV